jgi:hypothetical protein
MPSGEHNLFGAELGFSGVGETSGALRALELAPCAINAWYSSGVIDMFNSSV